MIKTLAIAKFLIEQHIAFHKLRFYVQVIRNSSIMPGSYKCNIYFLNKLNFKDYLRLNDRIIISITDP